MSVQNAIRPAVVVLSIFSLIVLGFSGSRTLAQTETGENIATEPPPIETMADMEALFAHEPGYREIQQVAMRYAEVHPDKIAAWRQGASLRAFLPEVDYDYGLREYTDIQTRDRIQTDDSRQVEEEYGEETDEENSFTRQYEESNTIPVSDIAWTLTERWSRDADTGWSSSVSTDRDYGERTQRDNDRRDYRQSDWRIRLQWDLGDFLYSRDQYSISVEARRLVELRQDVLQEVNTYFFDRRRAQIEMLYSPPDDVRSKIDLQLQIARVTASIDALTGGYLSAELEKSKSK
jgi:hypothetical protein